ncbi:hypothetical protein GCM10009744_20710 [Kribbella alba]|uniref:Uncharacterized protein n=1 Tax=Kribbella alba TaxID=190197 RepID=A0ABP4R887_9ACTN
MLNLETFGRRDRVHGQIHGSHIAEDSVGCGVSIRYAGGESSLVPGETSAVDL